MFRWIVGIVVTLQNKSINHWISSRTLPCGSRKTPNLCESRTIYRPSSLKFLMQEYSNPVDWKGLEPLSTERRCKASVKKFEHSPTVWAEWIEQKETLAKFQAVRDKETSGDMVSDDMTSKAERKRKSDASPVEFCRRSLARGYIWDSLADLLKNVHLRGVRQRGQGNSATPLYKYRSACTL